LITTEGHSVRGASSFYKVNEQNTNNEKFKRRNKVKVYSIRCLATSGYKKWLQIPIFQNIERDRLISSEQWLQVHEEDIDSGTTID